MMITLTVPGVPVAKARPKFSTFRGRPRAITPTKTRHYEDRLREAGADIMGEEPPLEGALVVVVVAYVPLLQGFSQKKRAAAIAGTLRPITKPDCDNYAKIVGDGLNQVVWRDDSQIVYLSVAKFYAERPRLEVVISRFGGE